MSPPKTKLPVPFASVPARPPVCIRARGVYSFTPRDEDLPDLPFEQAVTGKSENGRFWIYGVTMVVIALASFLMGKITAEPPAATGNLAGNPVAALPVEPSTPVINSFNSRAVYQVDPAVKVAANALLKDFASAPPDKRAQYIVDAPSQEPRLRQYYASGKEDESDLADEIFNVVSGSSASEAMRGLVTMTRPKRADTPPLTIFLKTVSNDPLQLKLDWETYIQEKNSMLNQFMSDPRAPAQTFRVNLMRTHLFDPEDQDKIGLKLSSPSGIVYESVVVVAPGAPYFKGLVKDLPWSSMALATVKLEWVTRSAGLPKVSIKEFVCWGLPGITNSSLSGLAMSVSSLSK